MTTCVSIIIPFYNEEENIPFLIERLQTFILEHIIVRFEVILVDDGSTDNSVALLKSSSNIHFKANVIQLSRNYGSHAALRAGIQYAKGNFITFMYADLQDPVEIIPQLLQKCLNGNEIAWASRSESDISLVEKSFSRAYSVMMKKYAIATYPEKGFDLVMFSQKVQKQLNANIEANSSIFLQLLTLGFKQSSIEYEKKARLNGKSKWTFSKKMKLFIDSFVAFSYFPIRLVSITGIIFFIIGLIWILYLVIRKIYVDDFSSGWPALLATLLLGFGITNVSLGIIAEYLWRTLDASRKRPVFVIDEIYSLENNGE